MSWAVSLSTVCRPPPLQPGIGGSAAERGGEGQARCGAGRGEGQELRRARTCTRSDAGKVQYVLGNLFSFLQLLCMEYRKSDAGHRLSHGGVHHCACKDEADAGGASQLRRRSTTAP